MNAINFIKENGVEKAREVVEGAPEGVLLLEYIPICSGFSYIKIIDGIRYCFNPAANNWFVDNFKAEISFQFKDLKRIVESVDMLKRFGGIELSKEWILEYSSFPYRVELEQAIADYESIYSNDCEILDYPEDYTSPNCKKYDERVK